MSEDAPQHPQSAQNQATGADDATPVATVAGGILGAFFDELEKSEELKEMGGKLRSLVLGDGVMAEPAIRAILFPDAP